MNRLCFDLAKKKKEDVRLLLHDFFATSSVG